jgi:AcrR family transcriptional regulator
MGLEERRLRDKERRIREILEAARRIFISNGYLNTTMLDIAKEAELSRGTLYLYFKSKEEITFQVIFESFEKILSGLKDAVEANKLGIDKLVAMKETYMDYYKNDYNQFYFTLFFDFKLTRETLLESDATECLLVIKKILDLFTSVLEIGVEDGTIHVEGELKTIAFTIMSVVHSTMQKAASRRDLLGEIMDFNEIDLLESMFKILFHSLT